ncbi:MAG: tryptophan synthase subunit alpha [Desulfamplus sp.]|nr:tryptophan synthase subunit alpha [Desulfamplus sp.]MBF0412259.1 tryptophan synthase subunit alpha [Desulfamplus sp.]
MLEKYIRERLKTKDILLMTHIVVGYPSLDASMEIVEQMVEAGVDLMELQIPFSEPMADGPVILKANQKSLEAGITVKQCLEFAHKAASRFDIPFLFMTYYNIFYKYGVQSFIEDIAKIGIKGAIIPDLPPEEGADYAELMKNNDLCPIYIFSPTTTDARMKYLSSWGQGFIYCMARKGVTGKETQFSDDLNEYIGRCRTNTDLPIAVGFGVKDKADMDYLRGKADIAVIGSQTIRIVDEKGVAAVGDFIRGL